MNYFNGKELPRSSNDSGFLYQLDSVPFFPFKIYFDQDNKICHPVTGKVIYLNATGKWMLNLCDGYHNWYEIILFIARVYKEKYPEIRHRAEYFVDKLTREGFIWWRKNRIQLSQFYPPPYAVLWDLTSRCNLNCIHCVVSSGPTNKDQLSLAKCLSLLDELANFGVKQLILSGGEPLVRSDFFKIAEYAVIKGFTVQLATNATLITRDVAKNISRLGLLPQVSLDAKNPKVHEKFRNKKDSWVKTVKGIKNLINENIRVSVAAVVTKLNVDEIPDLYRFVKEIGAQSFRIMPFVTFGRGNKFRDLEISPSRMKALTLTLLKLGKELNLNLVPMEFECTLKASPAQSINSKNFHIGCDGAISYCTINAKGEVLPCNFFEGVEALNVKESSFKEIWFESHILNYFRSLIVDDIEGVCQKCTWLANCRGSCIAANFSVGKMFQPNIHCWIVDDYYARCKRTKRKQLITNS